MKSIGVLNMIDMLYGENYMYIPCKENEEILKEMLIGHTIKKVKEDTLELDNGIELLFYGNDGCGGCSSGNYYITELNECKNVITNVEFKTINKDNYDEEHCYQIFVYAENKEIKLLQCDGDDGNGWYGTGYHIKIKGLNKVDKEK